MLIWEFTYYHVYLITLNLSLCGAWFVKESSRAQTLQHILPTIKMTSTRSKGSKAALPDEAAPEEKQEQEMLVESEKHGELDMDGVEEGSAEREGETIEASEGAEGEGGEAKEPKRMTMEERKARMEALRRKNVRIHWYILLSYVSAVSSLCL